MAYTPKTWACDDTITADDLNHIEQGIAENSGGGTALIIREERTEDCPEGLDGSGVTYFNATYQQVKDAYDAGLPVYVQYSMRVVGFRYSLAYLLPGPDANGYLVGFISLTPSLSSGSRPLLSSMELTASTATEELHINTCHTR